MIAASLGLQKQSEYVSYYWYEMEQCKIGYNDLDCFWSPNMLLFCKGLNL